MEWVDRMNRTVDYVEEHLTEGIDSGELSRLMACSYTVFQRYFAQIVGISLSEYIRRRRLTCATYEIQNTAQRIVDIALKYGYETPDAFCVAFKRLHGITPVMARRTGTPLKFYPRLHFTVTIQGVYEMNYQIIERESFQVVGIRRTTPTGGGTWGIVKSDGSLEKIMEYGDGSGISLGLCFGFDEEGNNDYMVGIEYGNGEVPGLDSCRLPPSSWLVFEAAGPISESILTKTWGRIYQEFLPSSEYRQADLPTIESYERWDEDNDDCLVRIWIPVEK